MRLAWDYGSFKGSDKAAVEDKAKPQRMITRMTRTAATHARTPDPDKWNQATGAADDLATTGGLDFGAFRFPPKSQKTGKNVEERKNCEKTKGG